MNGHHRSREAKLFPTPAIEATATAVSNARTAYETKASRLIYENKTCLGSEPEHAKTAIRWPWALLSSSPPPPPRYHPPACRQAGIGYTWSVYSQPPTVLNNTSPTRRQNTSEKAHPARYSCGSDNSFLAGDPPYLEGSRPPAPTPSAA